ncbi:NDP-sugar synthase [Actinoplanes sp. KI2]|uniref:NDP-sugar synthase n=1 Tax=Actinoplanes sp. KI2 TaxID=2983315 RepID=UPI0021D5D8F5|nr:NDP-sugar synthase [Actinoplanes sp. KI2]MCU7729569.1 NDP-sugar synthase [Actinoplanes sp. KI2]
MVAIGLAGGQGIRARPLTLEAFGYLRSKATMSFAGRPLIDWQVAAFRDQGIDNFYVVANGRENRYQVKEVLGHGDELRVRVRYSRPRMDRHNTGSGEATLSALDYWDLRGLALIFPTDSLFEFDLADLVRRHRAGGALVTMATVERTAAEVAGTYGTMVTDHTGWIREFVEKPPLDRARALAGRTGRIPINAGLYLVDAAALRRLAAGPELAAAMRHRLDWGSDLLPWLVTHGHRVLQVPIGKAGDLGNLREYLTTLTDVLGGGYPHMLKRLDPPYAGNIWIHESSLRQRDPFTGMTLSAKLNAGLVSIGPNVRIGRDVEIGPGVTIKDACVGDGVDLHPRCHLERTTCLDGAVVGWGARITDAHIGVMATVESTHEAITALEGYTALGHEATVRAGARLTGTVVYPRFTVPAGATTPNGTVLVTAADLIAGDLAAAASPSSLPPVAGP